MFKLNIPLKKKEIIFELDKQDPKLYYYYNLSRLAALFNFSINGVKIHTCVDDIFEKFISLTTPVSIVKTFVMSFEKFFHLYINARFPQITHLCFNRTTVPIYDNMPIYCFLQMGILIVSYSPDYLTQLINKTLTMNYLFGNDDTIKEVESLPHGSLSNSVTRIKENEQNFERTIDLISLKINKERSELKSKYIGYGGQCQNNNFYNSNFISSLDCIQNFVEIFQNQDNEYILNNVYSIQKNIGKIFTENNRLHLINLSVINYILESSVQAVLEEVTQTKIEKPVIRIKFGGKGPGDSENCQFTYTDIKVRQDVTIHEASK